MSQKDLRWDPSTPRFITSVLWMMSGLGMVVLVVSLFACREGFFGFLSGSLLAIALFLVAMQAGRIFSRTRHVGRVMLWLLLSQCLLWAGMAVLLAWVKVHPLGFIFGVSILPVSIILTLAWYAVRKRWLPS